MAKLELGLEITELRLGLPGGDVTATNPNNKIIKKRVFSELDFNNNDDDGQTGSNSVTGGGGEIKKNVQVVGWPPVCSYRRKNSFNDKNRRIVEESKKYVKVSMDGAPFLRKIDLGLNNGYSDLAMALEKLFDSTGISEALMSDADSSEYVPIYEDKDGDWMLAGDVPWEMFIESCKRLRIMKRSEAKGFGLMQSRSDGGGRDDFKAFTKDDK